MFLISAKINLSPPREHLQESYLWREKKLCAHTIMQSCNNRRNYRCRYSWVDLRVLLSKLFLYNINSFMYHIIISFYLSSSDISKRWFFDFQNRCPFWRQYWKFLETTLSLNKRDSYIAFFSKCSVHLLLWKIANVAVKCNKEFAVRIPEFFIRSETCCANAAILHDNLMMAGALIIHVHSLYALHPAL